MQKLFSPAYCLLSFVNLIVAFGYSMIATIVSPYALTLGAGLTLAGTVSGIFSLSALIIRPFSGMAMDLMNKRHICIFSTMLICVSFVGYAFAPNMAVMLVFRILHGFAFGINSTANMALISEYIPKERLGEGLGYFGMGQIIAHACGPAIGITIRDHYGYQALFLSVFLLTMLAAGLLLVWKNATEFKNIKGNRPAFSFKNLVVKECIVYALTAGLFSLGNGIVSSFLVLFGEQRGISNIALFFAMNSIALFLMRLLIGRVVDRTGLLLIVNLSLAFTAMSMLLIGSSSGILTILVAALLKAVGQGSGQIALQSACIKKVDASRVGVATSTYYIGADIGQGFGPILGGKISALFGYQTMFFYIGVLMIAGAALFSVYQIRKGRVKAGTPTV
ncbi:MAG: MFS transporter [Clostridiaceae bacterium]|nr:MFS transporter [Clostridiaceae bacterium]